MMTRKASELEAKLKLAATQLKEVKEDRDRLLQEQEDSEAEFLANLSRIKSLNSQLAELHAHHEDAVSEVNRLTACLHSMDSYHDSYDLMLQQNKDLKQEVSECRIRLEKLECKPLPSAISLDLRTEFISELSAEPALGLVSVAGCKLHTTQTIDLTKDDSVCNLETSNRQKHTVSKTKLKKYVKINKFIKKTRNLLKNQKHLVCKLKSKRKVLGKLELYTAQLKHNQTQYEADMQKLRGKLGQAERSLEQYISLYTQTTEQTRELNLAMDALLRSQFFSYIMDKGMFPRRCEYDDSTIYIIAALYWKYLAAKTLELWDTVFFVLRKKNSQITFLHVYHHVFVLVITWMCLKYDPSDHWAFMAVMNCGIHTIMYTYYALSTLGPSFAKYLWWKKYLTLMQLIQFVLVTGQVVIQTYTSECPMHPGAYWVGLGNLTLFFILFIDFYKQRYQTKTDKAKIDTCALHLD